MLPKNVLNLSGINIFMIGAAIGGNLIWMFLTLTLAVVSLSSRPDLAPVIQIGVMVSAFIGPYGIGWVSARLAADGRGPTYGLVGSVGGVLVVAVGLLTSGIFGLMVTFVILAGGLNGGLMSERPNSRRK